MWQGNFGLGALAYYGLDGLGVDEKDSMRHLALRGGPWTDAERKGLLEYCAADVAALAKLLPRMLPKIDGPRALLRGRFMVAAASMEQVGVPIDVEALATLRMNWARIQDRLIQQIDADYGVFEERTFKVDWWSLWLTKNGIAWPRLPSGALALDRDMNR
jgi:DNA polymerase I